MRIIIPFKEQSKRCPNKNFTTFPFIYRWLIDTEKVNPEDVFVVSLSQKVKDFVQSYGCQFILENIDVKEPNDITACALAAKEMNIDSYIMLPLAQPIRKPGLIKEITNTLEAANVDIDFVTTYQNITDRSLFYLSNEDNNVGRFIKESIHRKGCLCQDFPMIDGSIYGIKTNFAMKVMESEDQNRTFWSGTFKLVANDVDFFLDIDNEKDMGQFRILSGYYFCDSE